MQKMDIKSYTLEELEEFILLINEKKFVAKQIYSWLHEKSVNDFDEMSNISKNLKEKLNEKCYLPKLTIKRKQVSKDGTIKYLYELEDGNAIETVLMRYEHGNSICVSSQVGCSMGCKFCASTKGGKIRDLTASEILSQVYETQRDINDRVSNIVMMGIGEPLDNFENSVNFIKIISSKEGKNISQRNISLSTCGIVPKIYELAKQDFSITLSISLHATTNEDRKKTMPVTNAYNLKELMTACKEYVKITSRRISFEYAMIKDVNDSLEDAKRLKDLLKGIISHVNLIPTNPVDGSEYSSSDDDRIKEFQKKLQELNINATIRRRLGTDISAACGQLRNETN